jgi:CrcB protein
MILKMIYIGLGGFAGAILRYYLGELVQERFGGSFPLGILLVNIAGCFAIGFLGEIAESTQVLSGNIRQMIFVGLIGSFTTFSTFSKDTFVLIADGKFSYALLNVGLSVILGLFAVWGGYHTAKML